MKKLLTLALLLLLLHSLKAQTINDSVFNNVILIKNENISMNNSDFLNAISIKPQKKPIVIYNTDRNIPIKLFIERKTFLPKQSEFILITPDWEFYKKIREMEKQNGIHIKAERHKFYNIKRNNIGCTIDSLSKSIHDVRNPIKFNFKEIKNINASPLNNDFTFIIGKWKEIEYQGNDGANDYVTKIENGQTITFEKNGKVVIEKDNIKDKGKYEILQDNKFYNKLHISFPKRGFYYLFSNQENKHLALTPVTSEYQIICDEGCANVYKKID